MRLAVATALSVAASAAAVAMAEDTMPTQAPASPYTNPAYNWTGFYVGGHFTDTFGRVTSTLSDPETVVSKNAFSNAFGGMQPGYNYMLPSRLMFGAEVDVTFPNFLENGNIFSRATPQGTTITDQIDDIITLRARFGYAFDQWLIYGTGGFAWSQARFGETPGVVLYEDKLFNTRTGWALGLGTEVAIAPQWTARFEYLYDRFDSVAGVFPSGNAYRSAFDIQSLRLGLNYELGTADSN